MIKTISFLARRPGLSPEAFQHHWRTVHAPMWQGVPGLRGYVIATALRTQPHPHASALRIDPFDGVAQLWFDSPSARIEAFASPAGRRWLADGATIIGSSKGFVTRERVVQALPGGARRPRIKALSVLMRQPGATPDAFRHHWHDIHAPMAAAVPELRGFVISEIIEEPPRPDVGVLAMEGPVDGFAETWTDSLESRARLAASPEARRWFEDGARFLGKVGTTLLEEQVILPPPG